MTPPGRDDEFWDPGAGVASFSLGPQLQIPAPEPSLAAKSHADKKLRISPPSRGTVGNCSTEVLVVKLKLGGRLLAIASAWLIQAFKPLAP